MTQDVINLIRDSLKDIRSDFKDLRSEIQFIEQKIDMLNEQKIKPLEIAKTRLIAIFMTLAFGGGAAGGQLSKFIYKNDDEIEKELIKETQKKEEVN